MLLLAAAVAIYDGFFGPQVATMNLAGVLPWTHWRGLAVIALLMAGNLFCMACPFTLPRDLVRKFAPPRYRWPRQLRAGPGSRPTARRIPGGVRGILALGQPPLDCLDHPGLFHHCFYGG